LNQTETLPGGQAIVGTDGASRPLMIAMTLNVHEWLARLLLTASPPAKKTAVRKDQAGQASTGDGAGNLTHAATRDSVVETKPFNAASHRSSKYKLDRVGTSQQWDTDQVV
jgi:hypothetical protein